MEKMKNGLLYDVNAKWLCIATSKIEAWTDAKPFIIALTTEEDFNNNGIDYESAKDLAVGESVTDPDDFEGILVIRIA